MSKGRPKKPPEERKVITCVRVKPSTLRWYKDNKISMGKTLEEYRVNNEKEK